MTSVAEATELVDINKVQQWRFNYRQKVNPNLVTVNLCWGEHVGEALIFGLPYNGMRYKNLKKLFNKHSLEDEHLSEEKLLDSRDVELFIDGRKFYSTEELFEAYQKNRKYLI